MASLPSYLSQLWRSATAAPLPIGLEWGQQRLRMVQLASDQAGLRLAAAASLPYPEERQAVMARPSAFRPWMTDMLDQHGFKGRKVMTALPSKAVRLFPLNLVRGSGDMAQAVLEAVRSRLNEDLSDSVLDYVPIRNAHAEDPQEALVAVAPRLEVMSYLAVLDAWGLEPQAMEVGPVALARLVAYLNKRQSAGAYPHVLLVNFGRQRSHVSVVWGRRLVLDRHISFGETALLQRLEKALELSPEEGQKLLMKMGLQEEGPRADEFAQALVEVLRPELGQLISEINRTLVYTASRSRGQGVSQVLLAGSLSNYPGMDVWLAKRLSLPVSVMSPLALFPHQLSRSQLANLAPCSSLGVATGLALRAAEGQH